MKNYFELIRNYKFGFLIEAGAKEIKRKTWREMIINSYSQNYEDLIIEKFFNKNYVGKYLEIGAYHPTRLSNTYRFYKKGWRGVVVEPNPEVKKIFNTIRPEDKFINAGVSNKNGNMDYYQFLIPALNTFSKKEAEINIKNGHKLEKIIKIKTIKIDEIIDKKIDFLSIDTEGFDKIILKSWPWKISKPKVICVETNKDDKEIEKLLKKKDYKIFYKNQFNSILVWKKLRPEDDRRP